MTPRIYKLIFLTFALLSVSFPASAMAIGGQVVILFLALLAVTALAIITVIILVAVATGRALKHGKKRVAALIVLGACLPFLYSAWSRDNVSSKFNSLCSSLQSIDSKSPLTTPIDSILLSKTDTSGYRGTACKVDAIDLGARNGGFRYVEKEIGMGTTPDPIYERVHGNQEEAIQSPISQIELRLDVSRLQTSNSYYIDKCVFRVSDRFSGAVIARRDVLYLRPEASFLTLLMGGLKQSPERIYCGSGGFRREGPDAIFNNSFGAFALDLVKTAATPSQWVEPTSSN